MQLKISDPHILKEIALEGEWNWINIEFKTWRQISENVVYFIENDGVILQLSAKCLSLRVYCCLFAKLSPWGVCLPGYRGPNTENLLTCLFYKVKLLSYIFSEIFDPSGTVLFSTPLMFVYDTTGSPVNVAGASWYFLWYKQYLYTFDTITQDIVIKVTKNGDCCYISSVVGGDECNSVIIQFDVMYKDDTHIWRRFVW